MRGTTVDPVEIGAVASELASVDESLLERIDVLAGLRDARRLRGFADACEAALARRLDSLDHTAPHANGNTSVDRGPMGAARRPTRLMNDASRTSAQPVAMSSPPLSGPAVEAISAARITSITPVRGHF